MKHIDKNKEKELLSGKITIGNIINDYIYYAKQKGIDMKIGIDIATLTLKKLVQKIVLIDFVPATKLARIEGIILPLILWEILLKKI